MNRAAMFTNKLCYQREVDRNKKMHARRLKNMKSTSKTNSRRLMDNRPPKEFQHLKVNLKKRQLEEERYFQIERDNKLLMQKMFAIMNQKPDPTAAEYLPGLRISSSQVPMVDNYLSSQTNLPGKAVMIPSLNREARRRSYDRIMTENVAILARITNKKSNYSREDWRRQRAKAEHYLGNIRQDLTTGYLPQGPDGHSIYFDPSASSPTRLRPLSRTASRGSTRGSSRGSSRRRRRGKKSRKQFSSSGPMSPIKHPESDARATTAPANSKRARNPGCLLSESSRSLGDARGGVAHLRVVEIPTLGTKADGDVELATTGVTVLADISYGAQVDCQLTVDNLKEIAAASQDSSALSSALQSLRLLDSHHSFSRMSSSFTGDQLSALGRAVLRRIEVVPGAFGGYQLVINASETDHGEGGEPLAPPPPAQPPAEQQDANTAEATPETATADQAASAGATPAATPESVEIGDGAEEQAAATRLQAIQRGRRDRERVQQIREAQA